MANNEVVEQSIKPLKHSGLGVTASILSVIAFIMSVTALFFAVVWLVIHYQAHVPAEFGLVAVFLLIISFILSWLLAAISLFLNFLQKNRKRLFLFLILVLGTNILTVLIFVFTETFVHIMLYGQIIKP